jgi:peptide methionine sulfoxide reductase MsrA
MEPAEQENEIVASRATSPSKLLNLSILLRNQTMTKLAAFLCGLAATAAMVQGFGLPNIGNARIVFEATALAAGRRRRRGQCLMMAARECPEIPLRPRQNSNEIAIVALGWFWHPQPAFNGISERCLVGYAGGNGIDPTYQNIQDYTEAIFVEYDPDVTTFADVLRLWIDSHTPYPASKRQYRSAIWYMNAEQEQLARDFCQGQQYVDIEPATNFFMAEEYHQNYLTKMRAHVMI